MRFFGGKHQTKGFWSGWNLQALSFFKREGFRWTEMFFSGQGDLVAKFTQVMDHALGTRLHRRVVGHRTAADREQARIQLLPGGRTHGSRRVSMGEGHSLAGELVYVRGPYVLASVTAQIKPAQVIREDKEDIGFGTLG